MLIKAVTNKIADGWGRIGVQEVLKGKYKGNNITIERYGYKGQPIQEKHIRIEGPNFQKIINKVRNEKGKFDRVG